MDHNKSNKAPSPSNAGIFLKNNILCYSKYPFRHLKYKAETVARRCSVIKLSLNILQNSSENTYAIVSFFDKS